jgi:Protein of unknown function (DUF1549)/Protein of unknown function (DUF1553)
LQTNLVMQVRLFKIAISMIGATAIGGVLCAVAATPSPRPGSNALREDEPEPAAAAAAADAPKDGAAMTARIDELLAQAWAAAGVTPAAPASDSEFLRRVYLDLVGVIPRASEVREFNADTRPDKRTLVIDRLLTAPRHSTHMATILRNRILPLGVDPTHDREALGLQKWLRTRFAKNLRYDNLVGGLMLTSGGDDLGPALYFRANDLAPEKMAASAAELFLGLKLQCAECHDHPYAHWKQRDFWGVAAFFARTKAPNERQMGDNPFQLIDVDRGEVMVPNTTETVPPKYLAGDAAADNRWQSRRAQFTTWMASSDNKWFSRAAVNWTWTELFGQSLVDSLDSTDNPDASPREQLLDELATHFARSGFDLRDLWRTIAGSRAYQLSSRPEGEKPPAANLFAYKLPRPLTPEQMYDSFAVLVPRDMAGQEWSRTASSIDEDPLRMEFVRAMRPPPGASTEFRGSTLQALQTMNGMVMAGLTASQSNRLLAALDAPFMTDYDRVDSLYMATLSRQPDTSERDEANKLLGSSKSPEERAQVQSDLLWSLLNSTEFAFNR